MTPEELIIQYSLETLPCSNVLSNLINLLGQSDFFNPKKEKLLTIYEASWWPRNFYNRCSGYLVLVIYFGDNGVLISFDKENNKWGWTSRVNIGGKRFVR